jgi:hypothetical protein
VDALLADDAKEVRFFHDHRKELSALGTAQIG